YTTLFRSYFASITYLLVAGNMFVQAVGQAAATRLAKLYYEGKVQKFKQIINYLLLIVAYIGIIGIFISVVLGEFILTLLYNSSYAEYNHLLILVMITCIISFSISFFGIALSSMRYFKIQPYINLLGLITILISSLVLIPVYKLNCAAYTLIIGHITQFTLYFAVIQYRLRN